MSRLYTIHIFSSNQEAIEGIQRGLDDFEAGRFRSFDEFAEEQRRKYNLPVDFV